MNSLVQACHWLLQQRPDRLSLMGTGRTFFQALQAHHMYNPKNLLKDTHWRALVTGWSDHHRQHDVAEFFSFLCQHHRGSGRLAKYIRGISKFVTWGYALSQACFRYLAPLQVLMCVFRYSHFWTIGREHNRLYMPFPTRPQCSRYKWSDLSTSGVSSTSAGIRSTWMTFWVSPPFQEPACR